MKNRVRVPQAPTSGFLYPQTKTTASLDRIPLGQAHADHAGTALRAAHAWRSLQVRRQARRHPVLRMLRLPLR